jgi:hypothetical protein
MSDFKDVCIDEHERQQALFQVLEQYRNQVANSNAKTKLLIFLRCKIAGKFNKWTL